MTDERAYRGGSHPPTCTCTRCVGSGYGNRSSYGPKHTERSIQKKVDKKGKETTIKTGTEKGEETTIKTGTEKGKETTIKTGTEKGKETTIKTGTEKGEETTIKTGTEKRKVPRMKSGKKKKKATKMKTRRKKRNETEAYPTNRGGSIDRDFVKGCSFIFAGVGVLVLAAGFLWSLSPAVWTGGSVTAASILVILTATIGRGK